MTDTAAHVGATVRDLWHEVLDTEHTGGPGTGFFASGGDSIRAVRLVTGIRRRTGVSVPLTVVLDNVSLADLVRLVERGEPNDAEPSGFDAGATAAPETELPVLPRVRAALARYRWARERGRKAAIFTTGLLVSVFGDPDIARLREAMVCLVVRHGALRVSHDLDEAGIRARPLAIDPSGWRDLVEVIEVPGDVGDAVAEVATRTFVPFEPETGPHVRLVVGRLSDAECVFGLGVSHLACDGTSLTVLFRDLARFYATRELARDDDVDEYGRYLRWYESWLNSPDAAEDERYWLAKIGSGKAFPPLHLPEARQPDDYVDFTFDHARAEISDELADAVRATARRLLTTPFAVFAAAVSAVVIRYGCTELVFFTPGDGRVVSGLEEVVCWHNTMLLLRPEWRPADTLRSLVHAVAREAAAGVEHSLMPFQHVALSVSPEQCVEHRRSVSLLVGCELNPPHVVGDFAGMRTEEIRVFGKGSGLGCDVWLRHGVGGYHVSVANDTGWLPPGRTEEFVGDIVRTLERLCAQPDRTIEQTADWLPGVRLSE